MKKKCFFLSSVFFLFVQLDKKKTQATRKIRPPSAHLFHEGHWVKTCTTHNYLEAIKKEE